MNLKTEHYCLNSDLTLRDRTQSSLSIHAVTLSLIKYNNELIEYRLTFKTRWELYQHIDTEGLFNLKPEIRLSFSDKKFLSETNVEIETSLKLDLLSHLTEQSTNIDQVAQYILYLSQQRLDNPLLYTENWLGLSVKQEQESEEAGYRTIWAYLSPSVIAQALTSSEENSELSVNFLNQLTKANLSVMAEKATSEILEDMSHFFQELTKTSSQEITKITEDITGIIRQPILEAIINFFKADNWDFIQIEEKPILQTAFSGSNGNLNCYAKAREEQKQFSFYSIYPDNVPEEKRQAIAEFLTRANYGMTIGNFELDYTDGEIRYKTSIDVEGDRLTNALIKTIVYTNVSMMDEYLPGIRAVLEHDVAPSDAIAAIEGNSHQPEIVAPDNERIP